MKFDFEKAVRTLGFNEERLVETSNTLLEAYDNETNIFSQEKETCESILPEGVERGSREYASFLFFMTIPNFFIDGDVLFERGRRLYEKRPEVFDPSWIYEADKGKLKIEEVGRGKVVVAPTISKIIKEDLGHGFYKSISGRWYQSARKLHEIYDDDVRKPLKYVEDYEVALRRLDVGKTRDDLKRIVRGTNPLRFKGFGRYKTAPLFMMFFKKHGFLESMDEYEIELPFDTHAFNFFIGRGITNLDERIRKEIFARYAQKLSKKTLKENGIKPTKLQPAQWLLGSRNCIKNDCYNLRTEDGKQRLCPFSEPCKQYFDSQHYKSTGFIIKGLNNFY